MIMRRVSGDRENRESAGKLNDPGKKEKKREMAGNFAKKGKIQEFSFNYINFTKEKFKVRFCLFFEVKTKPFKKLSTYKIYLLNCISWGGRSK